MLIMMAARSKDIGLRRSLAGNAGSNHLRGHGCLYVVRVVCCQRSL
jgi:hypothetical protein